MSKVAVIQMVSGVDVAANLASAERLIAQAEQTDAQLVALPENFAALTHNETDKFAISETNGGGPIQDFLAEMAKRHKLWILGGTIAIHAQHEGKVRTASLLYNQEGELVTRYDKIHLFDVTVSEQESHVESAAVEPGDKIIVHDTPIGRLGLSVCYDIRFPELYREMLRLGVQVIACPAAFTKVTGLAHWEVLLRARAIENLSYVIAPNQGGHHENGRDTYGHSMIVDPWGEILAQHSGGEGIISAEIDLMKQRTRRESFPAIEHRKF